MRTRELVRPGTTVSVTERPGDGPVLVVVPGAMADAAGWLPVVDALPAAWQVHVLNRRGRAPSGPLGEGYSLAAEVDDVHALLDDVDGEVHLFGWSIGALLGLEAARRRDDLHTVLAYEPVSAPFAADAIAPIRAALDAGDTGRAVELVNVVVSGFPAERVAALRDSPDWPVLCGLAHPLADELGAVNRFVPAFADYPSTPAPVTLLVGEHNGEPGEWAVEPYGPAFRRFREAMPGAVVDTLPGTGHLAHVEAPGMLAAHIARAVEQPTSPS